MAPTRTTFAGYERLAPADPLSSDGYAFQFQNPAIADRLGELGAVTHRHDGHAAMVDPTTAPTVSTAATGGAIPAGQSIHVTYTLTDPDGGETLPATAVVVSTAAGYLTPAVPPTVAADYTAGTLLAGTSLYAVTVADGAGGETALGPAASLTIAPGHANARALLSGLTALTNASSGSSVSAMWRVWKSVDGGSSWNLMGTGLYSTNTFTDSGGGGDCTVSPPRTGTTVGTSKLTVTIPSAGQPVTATFFSIYADTTGRFLAPCLLATLPVADFDIAQHYTALTLLNGQPPAVSSCYPGANQIDPATDIIGGGGGGAYGPALGVQQLIGPTNVVIAASTTTTITIAEAAWAEASFNRLVVGLLIEHPDASQLAATVTDSSVNSYTLFDAGTFSASANIGYVPGGAADPDNYLYFNDFAEGKYASVDPPQNVITLSPLTSTSAVAPFPGTLPPVQSSFRWVQGDPNGDLTLTITESGGSAGTLRGVVVYAVSTLFDSLYAFPVYPPVQGIPADITATGTIPTAVAAPTAGGSGFVGSESLPPVGTLQLVNSATPVTLTIPANTWLVGAFIDFMQRGAGAVTFAAGGGGVTLNSRSGSLVTHGQYAMVRIQQYDTNAWVLSGDLA